MSGEDRPTAPPRVSGPDAGQEDLFGGLRAGTRIGKYEIVEMLGQGGFGITYRARDAQLRRDVAVKEYLPTAFARRLGGTTVLPRSTQTAEAFLWGRERFLDEARTLATLEDAPGIVNVYDFMEANGTAYMVMALVRGETLDARLKRDRRLPQPAIEQLLYPLLDGLEKVHEAGFLHRDIKPANILLDAKGRPTLIDFGASRVALSGRTQALTAVYTPGYAAFEQSTSAKQGPWTDIYALAATLYHCITGTPPPAASDRMIDDRIVPAVEAGKNRYAPSLLAAIDVGLKLKAVERPQTVADWRRVLSGLAAPAGDLPGTPTREMDEPGTRRMTGPVDAQPRRGGIRWPWMAAAGVALAIVGGGAWMVLKPAPETPEAALRRIEAEVQRQTALAAKLRQEEEARQQAIAEARRKAEEEAARTAAEEKAAAEAVAKRQAEEQAARKAAEEKAAAEAATKRQAEEEAARKAAGEKAAAETAARRHAEQEATRKAAEEEVQARRQRDEEIRREAEARAKAEAAQVEAAAREKANAEATRRAEEDARRAAEDKAKTEADSKRQAEAAEAALRLSEVDRKRVQVALTALGFNTQGSDGALGPRTRQMIGAWQKSQGATETGYLTAAQLVALRQQAAPALVRFDEEQKKLEDDRRKAEDDAKRKMEEEAKRRQEDEAKKRAEEERRKQQPTPAAPAPSVAAAPSTSGAMTIDGTYFGEHCSGPRPEMFGCRAVMTAVQGGVGHYTWNVSRCHNAKATVTFRIDASGALSGTAEGFDENCRPSSGQLFGRHAGGRISIESRGSTRATLVKK